MVLGQPGVPQPDHRGVDVSEGPLPKLWEDVVLQEPSILVSRPKGEPRAALSEVLTAVGSQGDACTPGVDGYSSKPVGLDGGGVRLGVALPLEGLCHHPPADSGPHVVAGFSDAGSPFEDLGHVRATRSRGRPRRFRRVG